MSVGRFDPALRQETARLEEVRAVAAEVLRRLGSDLAESRPTSGWVNPGWIADRYVVRVNLDPDSDSLRREVLVAEVVPPEVGYPEVVEVGVLDGHEYVVTQRLPGVNLAEVWAGLEPVSRADALIQLWNLAVLVHNTPLRDLTGAELGRSPFYAASRDEVASMLGSIHRHGVLTDNEADALLTQVERFFDAVDDAPHVLNHGDLHIGNALWDSGRIVSLLDLEFATAAPMELDLNELAKHAFGPANADDQSATTDVEKQAVTNVVVGLAVDTSLLVGYSILLESWFTDRSLRDLSPREVLETDSYQRLVALADGEGGHLATLISS